MDFLLHLGKAQTSCNFTLVSMKVHIILLVLILSYILRLIYLGYSYLSVAVNEHILHWPLKYYFMRQ